MREDWQVPVDISHGIVFSHNWVSALVPLVQHMV
jgi:hypothetical protein